MATVLTVLRIDSEVLYYIDPLYTAQTTVSSIAVYRSS